MTFDPSLELLSADCPAPVHCVVSDSVPELAVAGPDPCAGCSAGGSRSLRQARWAVMELFARRSKQTGGQFLRYLVAGSVAFVVDFTALVLLTQAMGLDAYLLSAAIAFSLGLIASYSLSVAWVFHNRSLPNRWAEFTLFSVIGLVGAGLTEAILFVGTGLLLLDYRVSKIIASVVVLLWSFSARKTLLFRAGKRA